MDGGYMYFVVYCFRRGENFYSICNIKIGIGIYLNDNVI